MKYERGFLLWIFNLVHLLYWNCRKGNGYATPLPHKMVETPCQFQFILRLGAKPGYRVQDQFMRPV